MKLVQVNYRPYTAFDEPFVFNSWLRSYKSGSEFAKAVPSRIFYAHHKRLVARLLRDSGTIIACNPEEPDQIFGYGCYQPSESGVLIMHYLYVKLPYRKLGIGADILRMIQQLSDADRALPIATTHMTQVSQALSEKWQLVYNPYLAFSEAEAYADQVSKAG